MTVNTNPHHGSIRAEGSAPGILPSSLDGATSVEFLLFMAYLYLYEMPARHLLNTLQAGFLKNFYFATRAYLASRASKVPLALIAAKPALNFASNSVFVLQTAMP
jgi:hypothetical protein